jgi:hypothetical protein
MGKAKKAPVATTEDVRLNDKPQATALPVTRGALAKNEDPVGYPGAEEGGEEAGEGCVIKRHSNLCHEETKKCCGWTRWAKGSMPLVMHIQKMGVSQSTAQAIAKRDWSILAAKKDSNCRGCHEIR